MNLKEKILEVINKNKALFSKYIIISLISYVFVFSGIILLVSVFKIDKKISFLVVYGINYLFLYTVQLKYLFKTNHNVWKLVRFVVATLSFYIIANIIYNLGLYLNINYILATALAVVLLMPVRFFVNKVIVYRYFK